MYLIKNHQEYIEKVHALIEHDKNYYEKAKPIISDYEYDQLMHSVIAYETKHPDQIAPNSPARRVNEGVSASFRQGTHRFPMMSLNNTYSAQEVADFVKRVHKLLEKEEVDFCSELKMDGVSISLAYESGKLVSALTRGDGKVGDDVTANIKTISSVPLALAGGPFPEIMEIRGEVHMSLETFRELNSEREDQGLELFANPRNAAAGSLKLLDPKLVAKRRLSLVCYAIAGFDVGSQHKVHERLRHWGLPVAKNEHVAVCKHADEIMQFAEKIHQERDHLPFEIDGIVIKVDELKYHDLLGVTGKAPRYAVAYKFAPEQALTRVNAITVQVGRTGVLTPVAELEPVFLSGSTIARATLHNMEELHRKDIRVGDFVVIEKAGDVIPQVVQVDLSKRLAYSEIWSAPTTCPVCQSDVIQIPGEVALRCPNLNCGAQEVRKIIYFASKHAMDIEHMGEKVVEQLFEKGLVRHIYDIYHLKKEDLAKLDGFKAKSIQNLLASIEKSKTATLSRFIMGLGIKYVGKETAELLAEETEDLNALMDLSEEKLLAINGIGEKTAKAIFVHFQSESAKEEITHLLQAGVRPHHVAKKIQGHIFNGKSFVLTGTLHNYSREGAAELIKERGGKVIGSVSKKTDYLLLGSEPGSKYQKALELNVPILTEDQFQKIL